MIHNVAYDLSPQVSQASARETMKPLVANTDIAVVCVGSRSGSNDIAIVSRYHCENPLSIERFANSDIPFAFVAVSHVLQSPEPIGKYIEQAASVALAAKGIRNDSQSPKKVLLQLERFDYDENSDRRKPGFEILPVFSNHDGVVRKGFLDVVVKVAQADGTISYQRRVSVEVSRKRGQSSSGVLIASVAIALVSPIAPNPEAVRKQEEQTVTADVLVDLFAKFQDDLAADEDLLRAIRK
jgi:hypothetical protein